MSVRHHTVQTDVNLTLSLAYFPLPLVSGVEWLRIQLGGTVLQQMPFAIVVAKGARLFQECHPHARTNFITLHPSWQVL